MKTVLKVGIAVLAVLAAFGTGLAVVYYAVPSFAPEKVEKVQAHLDSLVMADSLARMDSLARLIGLSVLADSLGLPVDSLMRFSAQHDAAPAASMSEPQDSALVEAEGVANPGVVLQDSVAFLQRRVDGLIRQQETLLDQIQDINEQLKAQQAKQAEVEQLSATLAKLEDKDLAGVVSELDVEVLEILYQKTSARNQTRLLQAMSPQEAANFVRRIVGVQGTPVTDRSAIPDTTSEMLGSIQEPPL